MRGTARRTRSTWPSSRRCRRSIMKRPARVRTVMGSGSSDGAYLAGRRITEGGANRLRRLSLLDKARPFCVGSLAHTAQLTAPRDGRKIRPVDGPGSARAAPRQQPSPPTRLPSRARATHLRFPVHQPWLTLPRSGVDSSRLRERRLSASSAIFLIGRSGWSGGTRSSTLTRQSIDDWSC